MVLVDPVQDDYSVPWPPNRPLTRDDLDRIPDDGHRYELIDGLLIMSPAPSPLHQRAVAALYRLLFAACPPELDVLFAPLDVVLAPDTVIQPDLLVAHRDDFTERDLPGPPLLAVEVLSPSTKRVDLMLKWSRLEAAGCGSYWVVDPDTPSLIAWEMRDGAYAQVAKVTGDEVARMHTPYDVTVVPADLIL
ncbi:MAG TPA: Uma2 family endonuclease [Kribbella sp.]|uniref:Uma2 family endonuclease n=1 Tax=Kribbella sp. TaxID=1871183 RepID=UPI002D7956ED|nr:Uma2 family endonuclease [Kribbella sp.]HET6297565.1 Uma2 family endonuclease [Kribbella sp.]